MLTRIILFVFIFAALFLIKEIGQFVITLRNESGEISYKITTERLIGIGLSISYIITTLICGF